jgi:hypothetical protein
LPPSAELAGYIAAEDEDMSIADEDAIGSGDEAMDDAPPPLEPTTWPRISPSGYFAV